MFDISSDMSFAERSTWIQVLVATAVGLGYFAVVLARAIAGRDLASVAYQWPLVIAFLLSILATLVAHAAVTIVTKDCGKQDERDNQIYRAGESVRASILSVTLLLPLGLAMAELPHFWIANSIYLSCIVAEVAAQTTKIIGYRRGLCS